MCITPPTPFVLLGGGGPSLNCVQNQVKDLHQQMGIETGTCSVHDCARTPSNICSRCTVQINGITVNVDVSWTRRGRQAVPCIVIIVNTTTTGIRIEWHRNDHRNRTQIYLSVTSEHVHRIDRKLCCAWYAYHQFKSSCTNSFRSAVARHCTVPSVASSLEWVQCNLILQPDKVFLHS